MYFPKPDEWPAVIQEFHDSGLTQKEFCAKKDLAFGTFHYQLYKRLKRTNIEAKSKAIRSQHFVPIEVVASPASATRGRGEAALLEAQLRSGVVVRFVAGTDTRYLAELIAALG